MLLEELSLELQLNRIYEDISTVVEPPVDAPKKLGAINVDYSNMDLPQLQQMMQNALKLMSIHGKLRPGPTKARHASRIMVFLNKIRAAVHRALKADVHGMTESKKEIFEQFLVVTNQEIL